MKVTKYLLLLAAFHASTQPSYAAEETVVAPVPTEAPKPAARRVFELAVSAETTWLVSDSTQITTADDAVATPGVRFGWSPLDALDVSVGWRLVAPPARGDRAWRLTATGDAIVAGVRGRLPIVSWLAAVGELDLEALHVGFDLDVGSRSGGTSSWTFGAVPRVGLEAKIDASIFDVIVRAEGGYAFRAPVAADGVRLSSDAERVIPIDLGTLDLSGPVFAFTLGLGF